MNKPLKYIFYILLSILVNSCGTYRINKTKEFTKLKSPSDLDGEYMAFYSKENLSENETSYGVSAFNLLHIDTLANVDFFKIKIIDSKNIQIEYFDHKDNQVKNVILKGKMKKKFFEIYFQKQQIIVPILFSMRNIDRIRIGKDKNDDLILKNYIDDTGNLFFFVVGRLGEEGLIAFKKRSDLKDLKPFSEKGLWGYKNLDDKTVIEPKYNYTRLFYNQLAIVKKNNKYGLIDKNDKVHLDFDYDNLEIFFKNGKAYYTATIKDKKGIVNFEGKLIIPVAYDEIKGPINNEFKLKLGDKYGHAVEGKFIVPAIYSHNDIFHTYAQFRLVKRNGEKYFLDSNGFEYKTDIINLEESCACNSFGCTCNKPADTELSPILSTQRKPLLSEQKGEILSKEKIFIYESAKPSIEYKPFFENNLWGVKNAKDKIIVEPKYDSVSTYFKDLAIVEKERKFGLINNQGNKIIDIEYDKIERGQIDNKACYYIVSKKDKLGLLDENGKLIIPVQFDEVKNIYNNIFIFKKGSKYGLATNEKLITSALYDAIIKLRNKENAFKLKLGEKYGLATNEKLIAPAIYSDISYFFYYKKYDYIKYKVKRDNNIFFIDEDGYEYEAKKSSILDELLNYSGFNPDISTKKKLDLKEQDINNEIK